MASHPLESEVSHVLSRIKPYISYELSRIKTKVIGSHNLGEIPLVSVRTKATVMGKT